MPQVKPIFLFKIWALLSHGRDFRRSHFLSGMLIPFVSLSTDKILIHLINQILNIIFLEGLTWNWDEIKPRGIHFNGIPTLLSSIYHSLHLLLWLHVIPTNLAKVGNLFKIPFHSKSLSGSFPGTEHSLFFGVLFKNGHNLTAGCHGRAWD